MKERIAALLMATLLILMLTACKKGGEEATTGETVTMETNIVETTEPYAPGVGPNIFDDEEALDELQNTEEAMIEEENNSGSEKTDDEVNKELTESETESTKATEPKATEPEPTETVPVVEETEYERYLAMSGDEQKAFMESFPSIEAFFEWLNAAKAEHEALKPEIPIEDGKIDLSEVVDADK